MHNCVAVKSNLAPSLVFLQSVGVTLAIEIRQQSKRVKNRVKSFGGAK